MIQQINDTIAAAGGLKAYYTRDGIEPEKAEELAHLFQELHERQEDFCKAVREAYRNIPKTTQKMEV